MQNETVKFYFKLSNTCDTTVLFLKSFLKKSHIKPIMVTFCFHTKVKEKKTEIEVII